MLFFSGCVVVQIFVAGIFIYYFLATVLFIMPLTNPAWGQTLDRHLLFILKDGEGIKEKGWWKPECGPLC